MRTVACFLILLAGSFVACSSDDGPNGPAIEVDVNVKHLCGFAVINEAEDRCQEHGDCPGGDLFCWDSGESYHTAGFCRECEDNNQCPSGTQCDHNWCHTPCTATSPDCDAYANWYCTGGFCRKPHDEQTTFGFCNDGNKDLEIYADQTRLYGPAGACVFSRWEWSPAGQATITLAPEECAFLNVKFTPEDVGVHRGFIEILSNSNEHATLPLLLCGEAVEAVCQAAVDNECPDCASCTADDFTSMMSAHNEPDCSSFN